MGKAEMWLLSDVQSGEKNIHAYMSILTLVIEGKIC